MATDPNVFSKLAEVVGETFALALEALGTLGPITLPAMEMALSSAFQATQAAYALPEQLKVLRVRVHDALAVAGRCLDGGRSLGVQVGGRALAKELSSCEIRVATQ